MSPVAYKPNLTVKYVISHSGWYLNGMAWTSFAEKAELFESEVAAMAAAKDRKKIFKPSQLTGHRVGRIFLEP